MREHVHCVLLPAKTCLASETLLHTSRSENLIWSCRNCERWGHFPSSFKSACERTIFPVSAKSRHSIRTCAGNGSCGEAVDSECDMIKWCRSIVLSMMDGIINAHAAKCNKTLEHRLSVPYRAKHIPQLIRSLSLLLKRNPGKKYLNKLCSFDSEPK